ncbi:MAG: hypothetical protein FJ100_03185 [Deltaproteobacteria bacterium]|nr:hypothetical protein [Deltaproteobacteria bacterium]
MPKTGPQWAGAVLALASGWPMWEAMTAVARKDYLAGLLLVCLTWVIARSGLDLATSSGGREL